VSSSPQLTTPTDIGAVIRVAATKKWERVRRNMRAERTTSKGLPSSGDAPASPGKVVARGGRGPYRRSVRSRRVRAGLFVCAVLSHASLSGCSEDAPASTARESPPAVDTPKCRPSEVLVDGTCALEETVAGLPEDLPCAPGERSIGSGCLPAGVPEDGCTFGFAVTEEGHCSPVLAEDCAPGMLMVLGSDTCDDFSTDCGSGTWGNLPLDATTQFVDSSYQVGDSDGTQDRPWSTIQLGVDASEEGALIAVAGGTYAETAEVTDHAVRVWGRCAELVTIAPPSGDTGLRVEVDGTSVRGLTIQNANVGVHALSAANVELSRARILQPAIGVGVEGPDARAGIHLDEVLIEGATTVGVLILDHGDVTATGTTIRGGGGARGISVQGYDPTTTPPSVTLVGSVLEGHDGFGVSATCGRVDIDASVIRDISPQDGLNGVGLAAQPSSTPGAGECTDEELVRVSRSWISDTHTAGVFLLGTRASIHATVIREVRAIASSADPLGVGIVATTAPSYPPSQLSVTETLIERVEGGGIYVGSSQGQVSGVHIRDVVRRPHDPDEDPAGLFGRGLWLEHIGAELVPDVILVDSRIERFEEVGIVVRSGNLDMRGTLVESALEGHPFPSAGGGLQAVGVDGHPVYVSVATSLFQQLRAFGAYVIAADARFEYVEIREVASAPAARLGDGIVVAGFFDLPAHIEVHSTNIESCGRAGVSAFWGAQVELAGTHFVCNELDAVVSRDDGIAAPASLTADDATRCGCPGAVDRCAATLSDLGAPISQP